MSPKTRRDLVTKAAEELQDVDLGDSRRDERLLRIAMLAAAKPSASLPKIAGNRADLEGAYRLLGNESVDFQSVLAPHVEQSLMRASQAEIFLAVHDTTTANFKGEERGKRLGSITNGSSGIFIHTTLAVTADESRRPLGVLGLKTYARPTQPKHRKRNTKNRKSKESKSVMRSRRKAQHEKETDRWRTAAIETQQMVGERAECIHVMDREGDSYSLLAALRDDDCRFVVRAKHDRVLEEGLKLWEALETVEGKFFREVAISKRRFINQTGAHPPRAGRVAELHLRSKRVILPKPEAAQSEVPQLPVYVVQVFEQNPPHNEPPVEWTLLTSEPIRSAADAAQIVDWYRARWRIEEYFKCLKTGCAYEERQLETLHSLENALALFAPIAWALLSLRTAVRQMPEASANTMFSGDQLKLLRSLCNGRKLSIKPTLKDVWLSIASLGGHLKSNGDPGWQTLADGYREFLSAERGWLAAKA